MCELSPFPQISCPLSLSLPAQPLSFLIIKNIKNYAFSHWFPIVCVQGEKLLLFQVKKLMPIKLRVCFLAQCLRQILMHEADFRQRPENERCLSPRSCTGHAVDGCHSRFKNPSELTSKVKKRRRNASGMRSRRSKETVGV